MRSASMTIDYRRRLGEFLRQKYAGRKIDVIIPALGPSLDFVLKYHEELFPDVPVVFAAIEQREVEARKLGPGFVGVPMKVDLQVDVGGGAAAPSADPEGRRRCGQVEDGFVLGRGGPEGVPRP